MAAEQNNVINGWALYVHPLFLAAYKALVEKVEAIKQKRPDDYRNSAYAKLLGMVHQSIANITDNPGGSQYRQGGTPGNSNKHWFRAKFGNGRYRLFYRFDMKSKTIILAWLNDEETLRTKGNKRDAYYQFALMLKNGHPPGCRDELIAATLAHEQAEELVDAVQASLNRRS